MHGLYRSQPWRIEPQAVTALILLLSLVVRFMQLGLIPYTYDQSYPAYQALALLDGGVWPLVGQPSSVFLDNPALMPYLQALPLLLYRSPVAVQFFVLAVNSTAIWFVWRLATDLLGRPAGWIAALPELMTPTGEAFVLVPASVRSGNRYQEHDALIEFVTRANRGAGDEVTPGIEALSGQPG